MYLADTNVISELRKVGSGRAAPGVARWNASVDGAELYVSVITLYELESGIVLLQRRDPVQGSILRTWLQESVLKAFSGRILDVDSRVASRAASMCSLPAFTVMDGLIAATAYVHGLKMITRNVQHFMNAGVEVINPWEL